VAQLLGQRLVAADDRHRIVGADDMAQQVQCQVAAGHHRDGAPEQQPPEMAQHAAVAGQEPGA
jgi:hypothetical protein